VVLSPEHKLARPSRGTLGQTADEFGHLTHLAGGIGRVFTFRGKGEVKALTSFQT
jgi:hypothetical protein